MLLGRLGLDASRVPHVDRHGLIWLSRGTLSIEGGCLRFVTPGSDDLPAGDYLIPHQNVSMVLLGPGSSMSHDAMRILSAHGCGVCAIGDGCVRMYTSPPLLPGRSEIARSHASLWADAKGGRMMVARRMYAIRLGEVLPHRDIEVLRGIEGAKVKRAYQLLADAIGIRWEGRKYDRQNPSASDEPNSALNYASTVIEAAAAIVVYSVGAIPQLGFIHEHAGHSFVLDVADLYRETVTIPCAFRSVKSISAGGNLERVVRGELAKVFKKEKIIGSMIDRIKSLLDAEG